MTIYEVAIIAGSAGSLLAYAVYRLRKPRSNFQPLPDIMPSALSGEPLKQRPPNIGGIGHPQYDGGNYIDAKETADYLRMIPHFGTTSRREIERGDLTWDYERPGLVAPDGTIWLSPEARAAEGVVTVPDIEVPKAVRFGWRLIEDTRRDGYCEVVRPHFLRLPQERS